MRKARRRAKRQSLPCSFSFGSKAAKNRAKRRGFPMPLPALPGEGANALYALSEVPSTFSCGAALAAAAASAAAFSSISF